MARCVVEFTRLIPQGRPPKRADRSAAGSLPSRAQRYCDALTTATGFGYWVFLPIDVRLLWTGESVLWSYGDDLTWLPLSDTPTSAVQFPGFARDFDAVAPEFMRGYSPPFLTALHEAGAVQIWTGLLARTQPGWSLSIRSPVNLPPIPSVVAWEGLVETDIWFGPLFTNIRLTRTDTPVNIRADVPFIQVQPIPQLAYREQLLNDFACGDVSALQEADWIGLSQALRPDTPEKERSGSYAVQVRKRRLCPAQPLSSYETPHDRVLG